MFPLGGRPTNLEIVSAFCKRWNDAGGDVYGYTVANPAITLGYRNEHDCVMKGETLAIKKV